MNNAGGSPPADAATASPRFSEAIIRLNLMAPLHFAQRANAVMQAQAEGGSIVNIASVCGAAAVARARPPTAPAKAGLLALTQTLAVEWAPKVRVNAITAGHDPDRAGAPPLRRRGGHRARSARRCRSGAWASRATSATRASSSPRRSRAT